MARGLIISIVPIILSGVVVILALYTAILYDPRLEKYIQSLCMLPYTLKGVILAISVLSLYAGSHTIFSNRIVMLTCVYSIIILPYVYQGIRNNMDAINIPQLIKAAEILGAGKLYAFVRIIVPNMLSDIMVSSLLAMSVVFSNYVVVKIKIYHWPATAVRCQKSGRTVFQRHCADYVWNHIAGFRAGLWHPEPYQEKRGEKKLWHIFYLKRSINILAPIKSSGIFSWRWSRGNWLRCWDLLDAAKVHCSAVWQDWRK